MPDGCACGRWKDDFGRRKPGSSGAAGRDSARKEQRQAVHLQQEETSVSDEAGWEKGCGQFVRISWEEAYQTIAERLLTVRKNPGHAQLVLMRVIRNGSAGAPSSCKCIWFTELLHRIKHLLSGVEYAWKSIYGTNICFPDLANSSTVMLWASNLYHSNTPMGSMYRGMKARGVKIIVVDPRNTVTAGEAYIHLRLLPGTDGALALGMAHVMIEEDLYDHEFVEKYVHGFEEYRAYVKQFTPEYTETVTGVPAEKISEAARLYATNGPAGIMFSAATVVHHINGVQNYRAVHMLVGLSGNYDRKGGHLAKQPVSAPLNEFGKVKRYHGEEAIGEREFPIWFDLPCEEAQCTKLADYILNEDPYPLKALVAFGMNPPHVAKAVTSSEGAEKAGFLCQCRPVFIGLRRYGRYCTAGCNFHGEGRDTVDAWRNGQTF